MGTDVSFVDEVVKLVFGVLAPVLSVLAIAALTQLLRKWGIELDAAKAAKLEQLLGDAVAQTEEWASSQIKRGIPVTAQLKAEHYLGLAVDRVPGVTAEEATRVAKTILGRFRVAAAASVSDVRGAATEGRR